MSDEEKELIEKLQKGDKIGIYELIRTFKREGIENFITVRRKYINIMINLIEKQSKEIEEFKEKFSDEKIRNTVIKRYREVIEKDYISKDKIKAKIEETNNEELNYNEDEYWLEQEIKGYAIDKMQSLLEKE